MRDEVIEERQYRYSEVSNILHEHCLLWQGERFGILLSGKVGVQVITEALADALSYYSLVNLPINYLNGLLALLSI